MEKLKACPFGILGCQGEGRCDEDVNCGNDPDLNALGIRTRALREVNKSLTLKLDRALGALEFVCAGCECKNDGGCDTCRVGKAIADIKDGNIDDHHKQRRLELKAEIEALEMRVDEQAAIIKELKATSYDPEERPNLCCICEINYTAGRMCEECEK